MRIWNNEGFEVESCGNASRCIADLLFAEKKVELATIDTKGGMLTAKQAGQGLVTVDNGLPRFGWKDIPLSEAFADTRHIELQVGPIDAPLIHSPSVVNVGNPHCIFWVKDLDIVDLAKVGPMLEFHPLFPELPFGGVGNSGMGKYHGRWGFEAFTNARGVFYHSTKLDPGVRYPPYSKNKLQRAITNKLMP
jgi:hypothetical protein